MFFFTNTQPKAKLKMGKNYSNEERNIRIEEVMDQVVYEYTCLFDRV